MITAPLLNGVLGVYVNTPFSSVEPVTKTLPSSSVSVTIAFGSAVIVTEELSSLTTTDSMTGITVSISNESGCDCGPSIPDIGSV